MLRKIGFFYYPIGAGATLLLAAVLFYLSGGLGGHTAGDFLLFFAAAGLYYCLLWSIPLWLAVLVLHAISKDFTPRSKPANTPRTGQQARCGPF